MSIDPVWHFLIVDDDLQSCEEVKEYLEQEKIGDHIIQVETLLDFDSALQILEAKRFDLLILDYKLGSHAEEIGGDEAGAQLLQAIQDRRFIPVIFYTGLPEWVRDLERNAAPLIHVVEKTAGLNELLEKINEVFRAGLPDVNRALIRHIEDVQRRYMWGFVAKNWAEFGKAPDRISLAYLLARRLGASLSGEGIQRLAEDLGNLDDHLIQRATVHPMEYYVFPPLDNISPLAGDVYLGAIADQSENYWVLLTPSCDMVKGREKAQWALLAHCALLADHDEYKTWHESLPHPSNKTEGPLKSLLKNNRVDTQAERYFFLPGCLDLPDLVVDFQQLVRIPFSHLGYLKRLASLDSPFAEALLTRFGRYFGRLGTPDLDVDIVLRRLRG